MPGGFSYDPKKFSPWASAIPGAPDPDVLMSGVAAPEPYSHVPTTGELTSGPVYEDAMAPAARNIAEFMYSFPAAAREAGRYAGWTAQDLFDEDKTAGDVAGGAGMTLLMAAGAVPGVGLAPKAAGKAASPLSGAVAKVEDLGSSTRMVGGKELDAALVDRVVGRIGEKAEQAALRAKAHAKAKTEGPKEGARARGVRDKVDPKKYRKMQDELGEEAVLRAYAKGEHVRPDGKGGYIGFPSWVTSPQALGKFRRDLDNNFSNSVEALQVGDPDRLGTWYDRAKDYQAATTEPYQLHQSIPNHAVHSAGVSPQNELQFAARYHGSRALGEPTPGFYKAQAAQLDDAFAEGKLPVLGDKIDEYGNKNDPRLPNEGLFGVNDFRAAQGFGYTRPDGSEFKGTVSPTMHPVMDAETAGIVARANAGKIGGRGDWKGPHIQEIPWVYGKAQDLYARGVKGRFAGDPAEGFAAAIKEANNTGGDYVADLTPSATYEAIPGKSTGHVPQMLDAPYDEKLAYSQTGRWDRPGPEAGDDRNIDALYSALGLRQLESVPSSGLYKNSAGEFEKNPMTIARPMGFFDVGEPDLAKNMQSAMDLTENLRAVVDAQEAGAWNFANTGASVSGKKGVLFDSRPQGDPMTGIQPSSDRLGQVQRALDEAGLSNRYTVSNSNRGAFVFPTSEKAQAGDLKGFTQRVVDEGLLPGSRPMKAYSNSGYVPGIGKWGDEGIEPTVPYSGEATIGLLERAAAANPEVARKLSESESVRKIIREKMARDEALGGARGDIQETRRFLAEANWNKAVELVRQGMAPAAALAALGFSANAMADEAPE